MKRYIVIVSLLLMSLLLTACDLEAVLDDPSTSAVNETDVDWLVRVSRIPNGETGQVTRVIDGDTIDVNINGEVLRVRYVGVNTPERDEACYSEATNANKTLVEGQTVRLERDTSDTDQYGRLLRYVYVDDVFVNATLIKQGYGEAVRYNPDNREHSYFIDLEKEATNAGRNCHPTGIFDDGTYNR